MSLRRAVNLKCKDCCYDPLEKGAWRQQVTLCESKSCPLFDLRPRTLRPIQKSPSPKDASKLGCSKDWEAKP